MKTREREQARALRRAEALSIKEIARRLGVATSSVSLWVRDIELTQEQLRSVDRRIFNGYTEGRRIRVDRARAVRRAAREDGRCRAGAGDPSYVAGCMLYWAEGSKHRNAVTFVNSDPDMVAFFVEFLRAHFGVRDDRFRLTCNLFADHADHQRDIENFWLALLRLPGSALRKSAVNRYSKYSQKKRQNRLEYGTVRVTVHDTRIVQTIYGSLEELAGIPRDAWLD